MSWIEYILRSKNTSILDIRPLKEVYTQEILERLESNEDIAPTPLIEDSK